MRDTLCELLPTVLASDQRWTPTISNCDAYLGSRTGKYEYRAIRYRAACDRIFRRAPYAGAGPRHRDAWTIFDVGAGWTEFDYCLRAEYRWRGRYIPVDGGIDGTDLNNWTPPREAEWFVALEIIEHLRDPFSFLERLQRYATKGIVLSTPNPEKTDVLAMDPTHVTPVYRSQLEDFGFTVEYRSFYGRHVDSLFAYCNV